MGINKGLDCVAEHVMVKAFVQWSGCISELLKSHCLHIFSLSFTYPAVLNLNLLTLKVSHFFISFYRSDLKTILKRIPYVPSSMHCCYQNITCCEYSSWRQDKTLFFAFLKNCFTSLSVICSYLSGWTVKLWDKCWKPGKRKVKKYHKTIYGKRLQRNNQRFSK